jgi:hypothetical protein
MMSFEADWAFLKAAVPDLREYILSAELYWTLRPVQRERIPQLTIGSLLLAQARLTAAPLDDSQEDALSDLSRQIHAVREEWRSNWGLKAAREFGSRLNLWQQYIRELRGDIRRNVSAYPSQVRSRAILRLLRAEVGDPSGIPQNEEDELTMLDQILRGLTKPGPFVWEPEVEDGFPQEGFWFLYVKF